MLAHIVSMLSGEDIILETVTIDVSAKPKSQPTDIPTAEPVTIIPNWIKIHAGWWAGETD